MNTTPPTGTPATRRAWIRATVASIGLGEHPTYGSAQWCALTDDDPRKLAAALIAAECWATDQDDLPQRLARELEAMRDAEDAHWAARHTEAVKIAHSAASPAACALRRRYALTVDQRAAQARHPLPTDRTPIG